MTSDAGTSERFRESTRAPLEASVSLQLDTFSEAQSGYTGNVSTGGMFVRVEAPPPVGTIVRFALDLGSPTGPVRGVAEVVWLRARRESRDRPAGMGLQFRHLDQDGAGRLRAAVEELLSEKGLEPPPASEPAAAARRASPSPSPPRSTAPRPPAGGRRSERRNPAARPDRERRKAIADSAPRLFGLPRESVKLILALALLGVLIALLLRL